MKEVCCILPSKKCLALPRNDNDKVKYVPIISKVRSFFEDKALGYDFKDKLSYVDRWENIFCLGDSVITPLNWRTFTQPVSIILQCQNDRVH